MVTGMGLAGHEGSGLHGGGDNEINGLRNIERWRGNGVS